MLAAVVQRVPTGTNLGLMHMLWAMLNGSFLQSRGAIFPALSHSGFSPEQTRRAWAALRYGQWSITRLLTGWREAITQEGVWQQHSYEGYRAMAVDITGFFRPRLKGWLGKVYQSIAGKALRGVGFGLVGEVGSISGQRLAVLRKILRSENQTSSEKAVKHKTLGWVAGQASEAEIYLFDAGFSLKDLQTAGIKQYVVRKAVNCTARRNVLPPYKGRGARPKYGVLVRPLTRRHRGREIAASEPDETVCFSWQRRHIRAQLWHGLVRSDQKVAEQDTFSLMVFFDPRYQHPLVVAVSVPLSAKAVYRAYQDRWPVEQIPLATKQMLGCHRSFVFHPDSVFRLPELALLAGNILSYLAAVLPVVPADFWDRQPSARRKTPGRVRRALAKADFPKAYPFSPSLRKKNAATAHLPKGILAHRRQKGVLRL